MLIRYNLRNIARVCCRIINLRGGEMFFKQQKSQGGFSISNREGYSATTIRTSTCTLCLFKIDRFF